MIILERFGYEIWYISEEWLNILFVSVQKSDQTHMDIFQFEQKCILLFEFDCT